MEITDFMGLLLPKSFTTDRLAKIYFCFYFIIFLWQNKDHSLSEAIIFHWILCFDRCHELCFLCPDPPLFWFHAEQVTKVLRFYNRLTGDIIRINNHSVSSINFICLYQKVPYPPLLLRRYETSVFYFCIVSITHSCFFVFLL